MALFFTAFLALFFTAFLALFFTAFLALFFTAFLALFFTAFLALFFAAFLTLFFAVFFALFFATLLVLLRPAGFPAAFFLPGFFAEAFLVADFLSFAADPLRALTAPPPNDLADDGPGPPSGHAPDSSCPARAP
ncbi:MAG: hypothetical protein CL933_19880 [Deltaproteobacteria bacterium]|nr:hypothetical protein [Deltaproteobacteria bacterium]